MMNDPVELAAELAENALQRIDQRITEKELSADLIDRVRTIYVRAERLEDHRSPVEATADQLVLKCLR